MADDTQYRINGRVLNRRTQQGERGLRVEAWDRDTRFHDLLGDAITERDGAFTIRFTGAYFGDFAPDRFPDLFFKIFLGETLLASTQREPMENVRQTEIPVTLFVDMPEERPATPDRVPAVKAIKAVEFVRQSDFRGVGREARDRTKSFGATIGNVIMSALGNFDFQPIKPPAVRNTDVVGQNALNAEKNLNSKGVEVSNRVAFKAADVKQNAVIVRSLPANLKQGDKVDLVVDDNDRVRGYMVVRQPAPASVTQNDVVRIEGEVDELRASVREFAVVRDDVSTLRSSSEQEREGLRQEIATLHGQVEAMNALKVELESVRRDSLDKDTVITSLREQVSSLKTQQDQILQHASPQRLADIEQQLERLRLRDTPITPVREGPRPIRPVGGTAPSQPETEDDEGEPPSAARRPKGPKPPTKPSSGGGSKKPKR